MPATNNNTNDDSVDDVPALIGRVGLASSEIHADEDDDDDDLPELMCRPDYQSDSSCSNSSNDYGSDDAGNAEEEEDTNAEDDDGDGSVPSLVANYQDSASDSNGSDDEDDNDEEDEEEDSIPDLVDRNQDHYDSSHDSDSDWEDRRHERSRDAVPAPSQPTPQQQQQQQRAAQPQRRAQQQQQQQSSSLYPYQEQATYVAHWGDLIEEATKMRVGDLKDALRDMGSSLVASSSRTAAMEKSELVLEYARLRLLQDPVPPKPTCVTKYEPEQLERVSQVMQQLTVRMSYPSLDQIRYLLFTEFNVSTFRPEWNFGNLRDLYVHLHMHRKDRKWWKFHIPTSLLQPSDVAIITEPIPQTKIPKFQLRQALRQNYIFRSTEHCQTHWQLARAYLYIHRQQRDKHNNFHYWGLPGDAARPPESVPTAVPAENPSARGTWVLAAPSNPNPHDHHQQQQQQRQQQRKLTYAWTDGKTICKSSEVYTTLDLDAGDQLVPAPTPGTVWVYYSRRPQQPSTSTTDRETTTTAPSAPTFAIDQFRCELSTLRIPMYQNLPQATQLVTIGQDGLWMLVECGDNNDNKKLAQLVLYDRDHCNGHFTGWQVPHHPTTRLFPDMVHGGVWLWVVVEGTQYARSQFSPGLYYVSLENFMIAILSVKEPDDIMGSSWLLASDSARQGLWLLGPAGADDFSLKNRAGTGSRCCSRLVHVTPQPNEVDLKLGVRHQLVNAQLDQVQSILDDGTTTDGALLHCKKESGWKLMRAVLGQSDLVEQYKCPKNAKIATTGTGVAGLWVLKKMGRGLHWGLQYLHPTETVEESTEKYVANSILGGGVVGTLSSSG